MIEKDIKKVEYRQDPDGNDQVDFIKHDGTKERVTLNELETELARIDSRIEALRSRRRVIRRVQRMIVDNDPLLERAAKLNEALTAADDEV